MKLQQESKKEFLRIVKGELICLAAMWVVFAALHMVGLVAFNYKVLLGGAVGAAVAVFNFYGLCLSVQQAAAEPDEKRRRMRVQASYNTRILMQGAWVVISIVAPCFQFVAGIAPLIFPRITIYYLQITGKFQPEPKNAPAEQTAETDEAAAEAPDSEGGEN